MDVKYKTLRTCFFNGALYTQGEVATFSSNLDVAEHFLCLEPEKLREVNQAIEDLTPIDEPIVETDCEDVDIEPCDSDGLLGCYEESIEEPIEEPKLYTHSELMAMKKDQQVEILTSMKQDLTLFNNEKERVAGILKAQQK